MVAVPEPYYPGHASGVGEVRCRPDLLERARLAAFAACLIRSPPLILSPGTGIPCTVAFCEPFS